MEIKEQFQRCLEKYKESYTKELALRLSADTSAESAHQKGIVLKGKPPLSIFQARLLFSIQEEIKNASGQAKIYNSLSILYLPQDKGRVFLNGKQNIQKRKIPLGKENLQ